MSENLLTGVGRLHGGSLDRRDEAEIMSHELTPKDAALLLGVGVEALAYGIRTCEADHTSHGGFVWPETGLVTCPDWDPTDRCGGGLHLLPQHGKNNPDLLSDAPSAVWKLVACVASEQVVITEDGGGKHKVPRAVVLWSRTYPTLMAEYEAKVAPLRAECGAKVAPLRAEYGAKVNAIRAEYEAKVDPIRAEYGATVAPIWAEYGAKVDPIWRDAIAHVWPTHARHAS